MDIKEALAAMQNLGVSLNDYDSEALNEICNFVHDAISISNGLPPCPYQIGLCGNTGLK